MCIFSFSVFERVCVHVRQCQGVYRRFGHSQLVLMTRSVTSPSPCWKSTGVFSDNSLSLFLSTRKWQPPTPPCPKEWRPVVSYRLTHQQIGPWPHLRTLLLVSIFSFFHLGVVFSKSWNVTFRKALMQHLMCRNVWFIDCIMVTLICQTCNRGCGMVNAMWCPICSIR